MTADVVALRPEAARMRVVSWPLVVLAIPWINFLRKINSASMLRAACQGVERRPTGGVWG